MLKIRKVMHSDCEILFQWRNNPAIYKYALNPKAVEHAEHIAWFEMALKNSKCFFYLGLIDNSPCGSIRYQLNDDLNEAEVSISIAPEFWGKGIAYKMMDIAEKELIKEVAVNIIHATVLNENEASMKLFNKAGFVPNITKFKKIINGNINE